MQLTSEKLLSLESGMIKIMKDEAQILASSWQDNQKIRFKNERDVVTKLDVMIEENLRKRLFALFPEAGFVVEEGISEMKPKYNWLIDPIDGTKEFASQTPLFVSQVSLMYKDEPVCAVIYNPLTSQCFSASKNNGTTINGESVQIKFHRTLSGSVILLDLLKLSSKEPWKFQLFKILSENSYRVRMMGGSFAIYTLFGTFDAYITSNKQDKIMDLSPRKLILQEAGCVIRKINIEGNLIHLMAHEKLADEILDIVHHSLHIDQ